MQHSLQQLSQRSTLPKHIEIDYFYEEMRGIWHLAFSIAFIIGCIKHT
jgi:hypothetical protein